MKSRDLIHRRRLLKAGAAGTMSLALPSVAWAGRSYGFSVTQVARGVWMLEGAQESFNRTNGGAIANTILLEAPEGAIIVDSSSTGLMGAEIRAIAVQKFGKVAATLITHHHPDHWFGNMAFSDAPIHALGASIEAANQNAQGYSDSLYNILGPWMSGTTPVPPNTEIPGGTQTIAGRNLTMLPLGGHTGADLAIFDEETGTLIAGDLLFLERAPSLPDAEIPVWLDSLGTLMGLQPSGTIPGHGPYHRSSEAIVQTRAYLRSIDERLTQAAELGLTPAETMIAGPVPEFTGLGANPEEYHRSVIQRWSEYEMRALNKVSAA